MTTLTITTPPAGEPVSLAMAKLHLRVDFTAEDDLISGLISSARDRIERDLGLAMLTTGFSELRDLWAPADAAGGLLLSRGPLISVSQVQIANSARVFLPLPPAYYAPLVGSWPARLAATAYAVIQPTARSAGLQIDYVAGFGPSPGDVPDALQQAILALVAYAYDHRGEAEPPLSVAEPWLAPWRSPRL